MSVKRVATTSKGIAADREFDFVAAAFASDPEVTHADGKGFGSGALKVNGKIFAMLSSKGMFVAKLPRDRVDGLLASGHGERFDPGHGRLMKEWVAVRDRKADWLALAREAREFVKRK